MYRNKPYCLPLSMIPFTADMSGINVGTPLTSCNFSFMIETEDGNTQHFSDDLP